MRRVDRPDPFRQPDWRWNRARWLREKGKYACKDRDDEYVRGAKNFQLGLEKVDDDLDDMRLAEEFPDLYDAWTIYRKENHDVRWTVEAFLLADTPFAEVADKAMTTPEVIFWYEKVFFNVVEHLHRKLWVINVVMGKSIHMGVGEREYDLLWKMFGYFFGPIFLESVITKVTAPTRVTSEDQIDPVWNNFTRSTMKRKSGVAAVSLPVAYNQQVILECYTRILEIERASEGGSGEDLMKHNVQTMLINLPFAVDRRPPELDGPNIQQYDKYGAEPRSSELVAMALNRTTAEMHEALATDFPEAKDGEKDQQGDRK